MFFLLLLGAPISALFPYTTLFRSDVGDGRVRLARIEGGHVGVVDRAGLCCGLSGDAFPFPEIHRRVVGLHEGRVVYGRSEEHTSELQSRENLVCRLLLEKKKNSKV